MDFLKEIVSNHAIIAPVIAWAISQIAKIFTNLIVDKKIDWKRALSDGGMPSAHSATVVALTVMCGKISGFSSAVFALSLIFSAVVMRDAVGVRRETGKQAHSIKELAGAVNRSIEAKNAKISTEKLKVLVGHTPLQVVLGAVIGLAVSILYIAIVLN